MTPQQRAEIQKRADDLFELRNTKLPRHHRDAEDAMHWAADEIERLNNPLSAETSKHKATEAKLARAVEALEEIEKLLLGCDDPSGLAWELARSTLAALKEQK